ncbi:2-dehydro-3-deoxyphosphogluconate aldolase/4-hydroxy-2-oxoglutarate aldolase [Actinomyces urogenitalis DSM 15434]|uniref:2-dehydro-3-deoxy-phosphogluconate aldolase n=2 Tax=Actinomyces urogenitalis TaxID=103621 RepID=C0W5R2_9ACTO|nr:bifunctional 4-hydroxy-2-oxoglutarate aldolase/2-dehydro-3-deoxy-phosphogluconate aldolase [Actinomyces urogenitalis]ETJ04098.1 MAG: 4-hydroxy-2-oxoglutarate aldolase [Actinomyces urogenitalis DORA_12]EEH65908.1 2-dehydro-3-deoxyphosphogluconate aldolase/4-hydroxy-2-oxoglutarate aldolase [Actinomyces urogenitalis DSM 15434]KGF01546.1 keto-deoxy-phosphogluconate aldolase [Actinomyces urogenitalis S6-C4]MDU0864331.1 bifunctional 4-hydroxy-2-oxoglutarate aldolase/2-dehydro-3-deoxy-phosphoglucon
MSAQSKQSPQPVQPSASDAATSTVDAVMSAAPVIPVIVVNDADRAVPLAQALVRGGITSLEITLRTPAGLEAIRTVAAEVPQARVGAGTVLSPADVEACAEVGATFLVSPGTTPALLDAMVASGLAVLPGVSGPAELMSVLERGLTRAKLFPASVVGGPAMLRALGGPFPDVRFCPTGGVSPSNARDYLSLGNVACVGGSWLTPRDAVEAGDWDHIEELARRAAALRP